MLDFTGFQFIGAPQVSTPSSSTPVTLPDGANGWIIQAKGQDVCLSFDNNPATTNDLALLVTQGAVFLKAENPRWFFFVIQAAATATFIAQPVRFDG